MIKNGKNEEKFCDFFEMLKKWKNGLCASEIDEYARRKMVKMTLKLEKFAIFRDVGKMEK